jgi:molybdopterin-guanine dinucleotide biosynthesis protein A
MQRTDFSLSPSPQQRVNDLKKHVFQKIGISLVRSRRNDDLPATRTMLDCVQKVCLARAFVSQNRQQASIFARSLPELFDEGQEHGSLTAIEFGHMEAATRIVVCISGEMITKRVACLLQVIDCGSNRNRVKIVRSGSHAHVSPSVASSAESGKLA